MVGLWKRKRRSPAWVRKLHELGVDEKELVDFLADELEGASRAVLRDEIVDRLLTLAPHTPRAQNRVADLICSLLTSGKKVDVELALKAIPALGTRHRSSGRLEAALKLATSQLGVRVRRPQAESLRAAGIDVPKRTLTDRALKFFRGDH
jgi:hypothetical protein